ncbi:MAG: hypothetical protein R6V04_14170 [bacterium]
MSKSKLLKKIRNQFWAYLEPNEDPRFQFELTVDNVIREEVGIIDSFDDEIYLVDADDKAYNKTLEDLLETLRDLYEVDGLDIMRCYHLASDGRYSHPRTDYYVGRDSDDSLTYVICGDDEPYFGDYDVPLSSIFEEFLEDLGGKHPHRAIEGINDVLEDPFLKEEFDLEGSKIWGQAFDPDKDYYLILEERRLIESSSLRTLNFERGNDHEETTYLMPSREILTIYISYWQGSPDYEASLKAMDEEEFALYNHLEEIYKDRIAVINPYPPHEVLKVVDNKMNVCQPEEPVIFNPDTRKFETPQGEQQCPPPEF